MKSIEQLAMEEAQALIARGRVADDSDEVIADKIDRSRLQERRNKRRRADDDQGYTAPSKMKR